MLWYISKENNPIFFIEMVTAECYREIIRDFISLFEVVNKTAGINKMGLWYAQQIQQCKCCMNSPVTTFFLETQSSWSNTARFLPLRNLCKKIKQKQLQKNWKYSSGNLKHQWSNYFTKINQTCRKEWMHALLSLVDITNPEYNARSKQRQCSATQVFVNKLLSYNTAKGFGL